MTKHLHHLAREFQRRLLSGGGAHRNQMDPVLRDGWAALVAWHEAGERVWRIEEEPPPELPDDLRLATAPLHAEALCYTGPERGDWIVVARHAAGVPIRIAEGALPYAFPEPMIVYLTEAGDIPAAGCLNLAESPTWGAVYLPAGHQGARALHQDDIAVEETRFLRALRHWYRPPAIVV